MARYANSLEFSLEMCLVFLFFGNGNLVVLCAPSSNPADLKTITMPAMARKAGGSWRPELVTGQPANVSRKEASMEQFLEPESDEEDEEDYSYGDYSSEELHCPRGMYYFLRSKKCVPTKCYGGNTWRLIDGSCVPKRYVDYANERKEYPGRFQPVYSGSSYVYRGRGPVASQTRHMTFLGKKKGPFTG